MYKVETLNTVAVALMPGMSNNTRRLERLTKRWRMSGFLPLVLPMLWEDESKLYEEEYKRISEECANLYSTWGRIIAVGESAGGSVAVRLLMDFPEMILGAWNVCGVLWFTPHQAERYQKSPRHGSFYASVNAVMRAVEARGDEQLMHRVVTTHSRFDGLVPAALTQLDGAQNQETWVPFHPLAIRLALATGAKGVLRKIANGETK